MQVKTLINIDIESITIEELLTWKKKNASFASFRPCFKSLLFRASYLFDSLYDLHNKTNVEQSLL